MTELTRITELETALAQKTRWAQAWKRAAKRKRRAASNGHVEPLPMQIGVRPQQTAELLNFSLYSAVKLYEATARLLACAYDAVGIVCSQHPHLVFHEPVPMSLTQVGFWWVKDGLPDIDMMDVRNDVHRSDAELVMVMVDGLKARLGLK